MEGMLGSSTSKLTVLKPLLKSEKEELVEAQAQTGIEYMEYVSIVFGEYFPF